MLKKARRWTSAGWQLCSLLDSFYNARAARGNRTASPRPSKKCCICQSRRCRCFSALVLLRGTANRLLESSWTDYPLLGTHRLSYIVLGAVIAAACWLAAGVAPLRYTFLLGIVVMINAGLVIASTAVGGVGVGQPSLRRVGPARSNAISCHSSLFISGRTTGRLFLQPLHLASPQRFVPWLRFLSFQLQ